MMFQYARYKLNPDDETSIDAQESIRYLISFRLYSMHTQLRDTRLDIFKDFLEEIGGDVYNFEEDGPWPVIIDEFVAWEKEKRN